MNDKVVGLDGKAVEHENYASTDELLDEIKAAGFDHIVCIGIKDERQAIVSNLPRQSEIVATIEIAKTAVINNIMNGG